MNDNKKREMENLPFQRGLKLEQKSVLMFQITLRHHSQQEIRRRQIADSLF